jgi:hypothetical protein
MSCGTQILPGFRVGFEFFLGAEREEIDIVGVRIIVIFLVKRRAQEESLAAILESNHPWVIVELPIRNWNPVLHRLGSKSRNWAI